MSGERAPEDREAKAALFSCALCACTLASSAQATHEAGAKHVSKLAKVCQLLDSGAMQKGDWLCVMHGPSVQHNFASKSKCILRNCEGSREQGLTFEDASKIASRAWRAGRAAMSSKAGKGLEDVPDEAAVGAPAKRAKAGKETRKAAKAATSADEALPSAAKVVTAGDADIELTCRDCECTFTFAVREQASYEERGYAPPTRCIMCRSKKRKRVAEKQ